MTTRRSWSIFGRSSTARPKNGEGSTRLCMRWSIWLRTGLPGAFRRSRTTYIRSGHSRTSTFRKTGLTGARVSETGPRQYAIYWVTLRSCSRRESSQGRLGRSSVGLEAAQILLIRLPNLHSQAALNMEGLEARTWSSLDTMMPTNSGRLMILMYLKINPHLLPHSLSLLQVVNQRQMNINHSLRRRETMRSLLHLTGVPRLILLMGKKNLKRKRKKDPPPQLGLNSQKKLTERSRVALHSLLHSQWRLLHKTF